MDAQIPPDLPCRPGKRNAAQSEGSRASLLMFYSEHAGIAQIMIDFGLREGTFNGFFSPGVNPALPLYLLVDSVINH